MENATLTLDTHYEEDPDPYLADDPIYEDPVDVYSYEVPVLDESDMIDQYDTIVYEEPAAASLYTGQQVVFGRYEQDNRTDNGTEPIEWVVLTIRDDAALLISRYGLDVQSFDSYGSDQWTSSSLRSWPAYGT